MPPKEATLRKRTQIAKANRTMFLWIAASSALLGFAIVAAIFLGQKLVFNEKILAEKQKTITTLEKNNKIVPDLESAVQVLDTDSNLALLKAQDTDQAVQVVLDALPSSRNELALGGSLQTKLLEPVNGLKFESLNVDSANDGDATETDGVITFRFTVNGDQTAFRTALQNLEHSIRTIKLTSMHITSAGASQVLSVTGEAYYQPAKSLELQTKVVRP